MLDKKIIEELYLDDKFNELYIDCPECECMEDDQYQCGTCDGQGGDGYIPLNHIIHSLLVMES